MYLCRDCKHCFKKKVLGFLSFGFLEAECHSPKNIKQSIVSGEFRPRVVYCKTARQYDDYCGIEGKWFEQKV